MKYVTKTIFCPSCGRNITASGPTSLDVDEQLSKHSLTCDHAKLKRDMEKMNTNYDINKRLNELRRE